MRFDGSVTLDSFSGLLNGAPLPPGVTLSVTTDGYRLDGVPRDLVVDSFGIRISELGNLRAWLRQGYYSWDGGAFAEPPDPRPGYAMTQLLPRDGKGSVVIGFLRHDRFQHRFRLGDTLDIETLWDHKAHDGTLQSEPLVILAHREVEDGLREWARLVAAQTPPRPMAERITGWCSWYNLYAQIDEPVILDHLRGAQRAATELPLRVFQIDDGFTPEMGDWLAVKPQFPRGMKPLLADIAAAGFIPGLWIAPFMVGNRSRLFADHPDWVVRDRATGGPLAQMRFYGEFRWHKRSEEYYILDVTHPEAAAYIAQVFRIWRRDWGCRYFKTDFMHFGAEHGPDRAVWQEAGLTRIEIWMRMARLIRQEIGDDALWLGCGFPLWPAVGLVDGVRIGRDIGVSWTGNLSAELLLRDQMTRNFAHGILWQADPDCILLRDRFHELTNDEIEGLARYAGLAGGVCMTSDHLGDLSAGRRALFKWVLGDGRPGACDFPLLGQSNQSVIVQRTATQLHLFNTGDTPATVDGVSLASHESRLLPR